MIDEVGMMEEIKKQWVPLNNGTIIHKTAILTQNIRFGSNCIVHPYAVVGRVPDNSLALARQSNQYVDMTLIGENTIIGCHAIVYGGVVIGDDCLIGDHALVREGTKIGDKCVIGANVSISYNVRIGNECRFQNGTVIVGDIHIGDECFFGINVTTSNDRNVDLDDYHFPNPSQPCVFGKKVMVGSGSNILAGCKIGDGVVIGAGALVVCDIKDGQIYLSQPANEYIR